MKENEEMKTYTQTEKEKDARRNKRLIYVFVFTVFQIGLILVFSLVIMKVRKPKFHVRSATIENFQVSTSNNNASFNIRMNAQLGLKNKNYGEYKYYDSTIEFFYKDIKIGEGIVPEGKVNLRSTKKVTVVVDLCSNNVGGNELGNEFTMHDFIPLSSRSSLKGKVKLMLFMKKKKATNLYCTMNINISTQQLQNLDCNDFGLIP